MVSESTSSGWRRNVACVLIGALAVPGNLGAAWNDRSGELPGLVSGKSIALLAVAGGGAVVALLWLKKRNASHKEAGLSIGPAKVDFGSVANGTAGNGAILVSNKNGHAVTIQNVELSGRAFTMERDSELPLVVKPGQRTELQVKFGPGEPGDHSGTAKIRTLAPGGKDKTFKVALKGKGI